MSASAIPPPPSPEDVTPDLGPPSRGSGSGMDRFRSIINHLSGGGTPAIQERLAADFAKRQHDATLYNNVAKTNFAYLTHAKQTVGPNAPHGINPVTGAPATAQDVQEWQNNYDTGTQNYLKLLPKDAKPIAQKLLEVGEHVIGRKGKGGAPAGQSSNPLPQAASQGGTAAIPPPPQPGATQTPTGGPIDAGGASTSLVGPPATTIPPPPTPLASQNPMELPATLQPSVLSLGETERMRGVQNELAVKKAELAQQMHSSQTTFDPATGTMSAQAISGTGEPIGTPIKNVFPAKLMSPGMIHPVNIVGPDGQPVPALQNKYTREIYDQDGNTIPNARVFSSAAQVGRQSTTTDPFGNVTTTVRRPIVGGGMAKASGGAARGGSGRSPAIPPPLDADGHIQQVEGVNQQLIENANQLLDGQDITKLPQRARTGAAAMARKYGWEQGKFTPKEQTQIREASTFIQQALVDPDALSALDGDTMDRAQLAQVTANPDKQGFIGRTLTSAAAQNMSPQQTAFVQMYNQLVGTIAGLSKLVRPGGTTEAQIERLKSELPNPVTTKNSADARARLIRLQKEIDVAMAKGNFGDLGAVDTSKKGGRPNAISPPPVGAKKQFYRLNGKAYDAQTNQEIPAQGAQGAQ